MVREHVLAFSPKSGDRLPGIKITMTREQGNDPGVVALRSWETKKD